MKCIGKYLGLICGFLAFACLYAGCRTPILPSDHGRQWPYTLAISIGSPYSEWIAANQVKEQMKLPVYYPVGWSESEWRNKYLKYAMRFEGYRDINYLYEKRTSKSWILRESSIRPSRQTWRDEFINDQRNDLAEDLRSNLPLNGELLAHYIPIWRGRDPFKFHSDYLVVFTTNNTIAGYSHVNWGLGRGELEYIEKEFGFVP